MKAGLPIVALAVICLCACSTTRTAPRFTQPSTQRIATGVTSARKSVQAANQKAQAIQQVAEKDCPELKLQITSLESNLVDALSSLSETEGARTQLESQIKTQTDAANQLVDRYNKSEATMASIKASRHRWVTYFLYSSGLLALSVLWILRKPLFLLIAGGGL